MMKIVEGFEAYRISDTGLLESNWRTGPHYPGMPMDDKWVAKPVRYSQEGYRQVDLRGANGKQRRTHIHRLVAEAFLPAPKDGQCCVRHLDGNSKNNNLINLAWGTYKENEDDKIAHGTWDTRNGGARVTAAQVLEIRDRASNGETHKTLADIYGVSRPTVTRIVNKSIWRRV